MVIRKLTLLLLLAGSCSSGDNTPSLPTFDPDALISVSGTMIDIRDVRSGDAYIPKTTTSKSHRSSQLHLEVICIMPPHSVNTGV